jgi:ABC-2 type transport system permease protein
MRSWIAFWNILMKDMKNYYLKPPNVSWGLIFPVDRKSTRLNSSH